LLLATARRDIFLGIPKRSGFPVEEDDPGDSFAGSVAFCGGKFFVAASKVRAILLTVRRLVALYP
jgi:hypothetical protein